MKQLLALALLLAGSAAGAADAPFLWEITGPKAHHYLMGSVHLLPETAYPLPSALDHAYAAADTLVLESDLAALTSPQLQAQMLAMGSTATGLKSEVGEALYQRVQAYARAHAISAQICDSLKAWYCALTLEVMTFQQTGSRSELGLDQHYYEQALAAHKTIRWLEDPQVQLDVFAGMPAAASLEMLEGTLDEQGSEGGSPEELLSAWQRSDVAALEKLVREFRQTQPALYQRILTARNRAWTPRLVQLVKLPRTQLVIVGAAHLIGSDGLVQQLRARGYKVQAVPQMVDAATPP